MEGTMICDTVWDEPPEYVVFKGHGDWPWYVPERTTTRNGKYKTRYGREVPLCECCGYAIGDRRWNHCPKCGARIEDEEES